MHAIILAALLVVCASLDVDKHYLEAFQIEFTPAQAALYQEFLDEHPELANTPHNACVVNDDLGEVVRFVLCEDAQIVHTHTYHGDNRIPRPPDASLAVELVFRLCESHDMDPMTAIFCVGVLLSPVVVALYVIGEKTWPGSGLPLALAFFVVFLGTSTAAIIGLLMGAWLATIIFNAVSAALRIELPPE